MNASLLQKSLSTTGFFALTFAVMAGIQLAASRLAEPYVGLWADAVYLILTIPGIMVAGLILLKLVPAWIGLTWPEEELADGGEG